MRYCALKFLNWLTADNNNKIQKQQKDPNELVIYDDFVIVMRHPIIIINSHIDRKQTYLSGKMGKNEKLNYMHIYIYIL